MSFTEVARWALLFDEDGCTLPVKTSSLTPSPVSEGGVAFTVLEKTTYKVEVLKLADSKAELNSFEIDWEKTERSEAISTAKEGEQTGGYLSICPVVDPVAAPHDSFETLDHADLAAICTPPPLQSPSSLREEIRQLRETQEVMMDNQSKMMQMMLDMHELLLHRLDKKKRHRAKAEVKAREETGHDLAEEVTPDSSQKDVSPPFPPPSQTHYEDFFCDDLLTEIHQTMEPACEPVCEPVCEVVCEQVGEPLCELVCERLCEPVRELVSEPVSVTVSEPACDIVDIVHAVEIDADRTKSSPPLQTINVNDIRPLAKDSPKRSYVPSYREGNINIGSTRTPIYVPSIAMGKSRKLPNSKRFILAMMDFVFTYEELSTSSLEGGNFKYRGHVVEKKKLCEVKLGAIYRQASVIYENTELELKTSINIRNAINSKCRTKRLASLKPV